MIIGSRNTRDDDDDQCIRNRYANGYFSLDSGLRNNNRTTRIVITEMGISTGEKAHRDSCIQLKGIQKEQSVWGLGLGIRVKYAIDLSGRTEA